MNRTALSVLLLLLASSFSLAANPEAPTVKTPPESETHIEAEKSGACDYDGFLNAAMEAKKLRSTRLLSAEEFAKMAAEKGTVVLDARGKDAFDALRVKGSINLPYTDFSQSSLYKIIPDDETRILIYCRNNITSMGDGPTGNLQFRKAPFTGLNIPTYSTLYVYGYRNVYELDPVVDPNDSPIEFEGTAKR